MCQDFVQIFYEFVCGFRGIPLLSFHFDNTAYYCFGRFGGPEKSLKNFLAKS